MPLWGFQSKDDLPSGFYPELPSPKTTKDYEKVAEEAKKRVISLAFGGELEGWKRVEFENEFGIEIFDKSDEGTSIKCLRAKGLFPVPPKYVFWEFVAQEDIEIRKRYDPDMQDTKLIEWIDEDIRVYWAGFNAPFPVKKRDFVVITHFDQLQDGTYIGLGTSINHPNGKENPDYVRAVNLTSAWIMESVPGNPNQCYVTRLIQMDPKGNIPAFVVNLSKKKPGLLLIAMIKMCQQRTHEMHKYKDKPIPQKTRLLQKQIKEESLEKEGTYH